jgi:hypothetical protein
VCRRGICIAYGLGALELLFAFQFSNSSHIWSPSRHASTTHNRMFPGATMPQRGIHRKLDIVYMALAPGAGKPGGASTRRVGQNDFPQAETTNFSWMVACRVGTCWREDRGCVCVSPLLGQRHRVPRIFQSKKTHSWASNKGDAGRLLI